LNYNYEYEVFEYLFSSVKQSVQKSITMRPATMIQTKTYNVRESYKCAENSAGEVEIHTGEKVRVLIKECALEFKIINIL
jgi:hypothetical protein